jgi:hypothetical protein
MSLWAAFVGLRGPGQAVTVSEEVRRQNLSLPANLPNKVLYLLARSLRKPFDSPTNFLRKLF